MFDTVLVLSIFKQIYNALETIQSRFEPIKTVENFTESPTGLEKLDSICMQFIAVGESLKNIDKITNSLLLKDYPTVDWKGIKGFRDIISHHYFEIDAEEVFWVCTNELPKLSQIIKQIITDLEK